MRNERSPMATLPTAVTLLMFYQDGATQVVNCRSTVQPWISQALAVERDKFGPARVVHAPMWDFGHPQPPRLWSAAARFAAQVLTDDPNARVLVHCQQGRRRSIMLTYAVLRLRGHSPDATNLISSHRAEAQLVDAYTPAS